MSLENLLEGKVQVSLINEPIEPLSLTAREPPLTAREIAERRWGVQSCVIKEKQNGC